MHQASKSTEVWKGIYADGKNDLVYPNDSFVRIFARFFSGSQRPLHVLDYGFGTGANLIHMARLGHVATGIEISQHALDIAAGRLDKLGLKGDLSLITPGEAIAYPDNHFDVVLSWQVIYYNDWDGIRAIIREFERIVRPGGTIIIAMAAPGDVSQQMADLGPDNVYISKVPSQEGCVLVIPEQGDLEKLFVGENRTIGKFGMSYQNIASHHWIVTYQPKAA
jgi:SAM-dependent methyltransferase